MARKTTPERPPSKSELSMAGTGTENPKNLKPKQVKTLAARVLSEGNKRKKK